MNNSRKLIEDLVKHGVSIKLISTKANIPISCLYNLKSGKTTRLKYNNFKKVVGLYCGLFDFT